MANRSVEMKGLQRRLQLSGFRRTTAAVVPAFSGAILCQQIQPLNTQAGNEPHPSAANSGVVNCSGGGRVAADLQLGACDHCRAADGLRYEPRVRVDVFAGDVTHRHDVFCAGLLLVALEEFAESDSIAGGGDGLHRRRWISADAINQALFEPERRRKPAARNRALVSKLAADGLLAGGGWHCHHHCRPDRRTAAGRVTASRSGARRHHRRGSGARSAVSRFLAVGLHHFRRHVKRNRSHPSRGIQFRASGHLDAGCHRARSLDVD